MPEPFTALIMAAGKGTRMRSSLPKVLHPVCGRPMVEWVIDAARAAGASEVVCITRPGDGVAEGLPDGRDRGRADRGRGHRRRGPGGARGRRPRAPWSSCSGDHPLIAAGPDRAAGRRRTPRARPPPRCSPPRSSTRRATGAIVRGADGAVERIVETKVHRGRARGGAGDRRDQHRHLRVRGRRAVARAGRGRREGRRALPHRRLPGDARGGQTVAVPPHRRREQRAGREQPRGADGGRAPRPAPDPRARTRARA